MENKKQKLSEVIVSDELNVDVLLDIIRRFIKVNPEKNQVIPLPDFFRLRYKDAVIVALLGFKVLREWGTREKEAVGPKEIALNSGINLSTTKNALRELEKERLATSFKGKYFIPNFSLYILKDRFASLDLEEPSKKIAGKNTERIRRTDFSRVNKILETNPEEFTDSFYEFFAQKKGQYLKKSLILIKIARDRFNIDGLTTSEITKILKDYLRVPMIHQPNISTALGSRDASRYVIKEPTKSKKVYLYKLTKIGERFVNDLDSQLKEK